MVTTTIIIIIIIIISINAVAPMSRQLAFRTQPPRHTLTHTRSLSLSLSHTHTHGQEDQKSESHDADRCFPWRNVRLPPTVRRAAARETGEPGERAGLYVQVAIPPDPNTGAGSIGGGSDLKNSCFWLCAATTGVGDKESERADCLQRGRTSAAVERGGLASSHTGLSVSCCSCSCSCSCSCACSCSCSCACASTSGCKAIWWFSSLNRKESNPQSTTAPHIACHRSCSALLHWPDHPPP